MKHTILTIFIAIIILLLSISGLRTTDVGGGGFSIEIPRFKENDTIVGGRYMCSHASYSTVGAKKAIFTINGTLKSGELEIVIFNDVTGLEFERKTFTQAGSVDFSYEINKKLDGVGFKYYYTDDTDFVGLAGIKLYNNNYKTWFPTY